MMKATGCGIMMHAAVHEITFASTKFLWENFKMSMQDLRVLYFFVFFREVLQSCFKQRSRTKNVETNDHVNSFTAWL